MEWPSTLTQGSYAPRAAQNNCVMRVILEYPHNTVCCCSIEVLAIPCMKYRYTLLINQINRYLHRRDRCHNATIKVFTVRIHCIPFHLCIHRYFHSCFFPEHEAICMRWRNVNWPHKMIYLPLWISACACLTVITYVRDKTLSNHVKFVVNITGLNQQKRKLVWPDPHSNLIKTKRKGNI